MARTIRILVIAGVAIGALSLSASHLKARDNIAPALLLGIDNARCAAATTGPERKLFYKIAAQANELKPFGTLPQTGAAPQHPSDDPPLWKNLGTLSYRIDTSEPLAQAFFDQGLRLTYAFNHAEAGRAFRKAQQLDPNCAMCYWGEALVLGPNINAPMDDAAIAPALAAVTRARELSSQSHPREQALIAALAQRYSADPKAERAKLDAAYAGAMAKVATRYPQDQEIAVLYAESLMDLSPWDYWEAGGAKPKGQTGTVVATLERVLKANPNHPGAIHYYIHTVEASLDPKRAEPYADRLANLVPGAGHLVHMPAHIYYRVGRYKDALELNKRAVAVDEAYIAEQNPEGIYPMAYYPHNVHFVLASAQMAGDGKTVIEAANKLAAIVTEEAAREFALAQPVKAAPYFAHAQFSAPQTILALPAPGAGLPYVAAIRHYARGVAFVEQDDFAGAAREAAEIAHLRRTADFSMLSAAQIPAKDVLLLAEEVLMARMAQARGELPAAIAHFKKAAALEDQLAYMEPPYWYYPVQHSLGATQLMAGDLDGAEQSFRASLVRAPNNGWALYGLSEVYRKRGDTRRLAATEELLKEAWAGRPEDLNLARL